MDITHYLKDSITTWEIQAVSVSPTKGKIFMGYTNVKINIAVLVPIEANMFKTVAFSFFSYNQSTKHRRKLSLSIYFI